jgi:signal transduction histidine kinase
MGNSSRKLLEEKLLKLDRLASIGELAGMIAHDLRNPLQSIAGATYYFKAKYAPALDQRGTEMLGIIEESINYSNKIITDLLEYSRETTLELVPTTPKTLMGMALVRVHVSPNIQIVDKTQDTIVVSADSVKLARVFINLITNAFDAMSNGGILTVASKRKGSIVAISFEDTGVGMNKETLKKIWMPLFTTKAKGMGFGLSICKRIVEAHGGRITVKSTMGKGRSSKYPCPSTKAFSWMSTIVPQSPKSV